MPFEIILEHLDMVMLGFSFAVSVTEVNLLPLCHSTGREGSTEEAEDAGISASESKIKRTKEC